MIELKDYLRVSIILTISLYSLQAAAECKTTIECSQEAVEAATQAAAIAKVSGVPSGAVLAFNRPECPKYWTEYEKGYGRFIRGIDKSKPSEKIDPQGEREPGDTQEDSIKEHNHNLPERLNHSGDSMGETGSGNHHGHRVRGTTENAGEQETRPKNVALLLCEKD